MAENVWGINHSVLKKSCATCFHFHGLATYCEVNVRARHQHSKTEINDQRFPNVFTLKKHQFLLVQQLQTISKVSSSFPLSDLQTHLQRSKHTGVLTKWTHCADSIPCIWLVFGREEEINRVP